MQKINISKQNDGVDLQIFDKWYAYKQSQDSENFKTDVEVVFEPVPKAGYLNIWFEHMPEAISPEIDNYDIILISNSGEPVETSTDVMAELLERDNVYLLCNAYLTQNHILAKKVIWSPSDILLCGDLWTRPFYPHLYQNYQNFKRKRTTTICAVNGLNRSWRHQFFNLLKEKIPQMHIRNTWEESIIETDGSRWSSTQDKMFLETVNQKYCNLHSQGPITAWHNSPHWVGINRAFGRQNMTAVILNEYFDSHCVVFPETVWQNDELCFTEKILKCFHAECFPFPIGGRNLNQLYNSMGFYTAWNLLPKTLQEFDHVEHHETRHQQQIGSIKWLLDNPEVFSSNQAKDMLQSNKINFLIKKPDMMAAEMFDQFLETSFEKYLQQ